MTPTDIRKSLISIIQNMGENTAHYVKEPERNFCRKRKLPFETMLAAILGMGGGSLTNELLDCFECAEDVASTPAFIQQRAIFLIQLATVLRKSALLAVMWNSAGWSFGNSHKPSCDDLWLLHFLRTGSTTVLTTT